MSVAALTTHEHDVDNVAIASTVNSTFIRFIDALRMADVRVSPAESIDALTAVERIGLQHKGLLRDSLAAVLAKTVVEKALFDAVFDRFFQFIKFNELKVQVKDKPLSSAQRNEQAMLSSEPGEAAKSAPESSVTVQQPDEQAGFAAAATDELSPDSALGQLLMANDQATLSQNLALAGRQVKVENIQVFTQKGLYTQRILDIMMQQELRAEVRALKATDRPAEQQLAERLQQRFEALRDQTRNYVEQQFMMHADGTGRRIQEQLLRTVKLSNLDQRAFEQMQQMVMRLARKLATQYSHRRRLGQRRKLHVSATLRGNMGFDGNLFKLHWRTKQVTRPKLFVLCDVSGSMRHYARFMLMLLYALEQVLPKTRAFAFAGNLAEVTEVFRQNELPQAITRTLNEYSGGSTDYGQAWKDFHQLCLQDVCHQSTIIVLGDGRNNYGDPQTPLLRALYHKCQRLIWLNPEPRYNWSSGDAEMIKYTPFCHQAEVCNSLAQLERIISRLLWTLRR